MEQETAPMQTGFVNPTPAPRQHPLDAWMQERWSSLLQVCGGDRWEAWFRLAFEVIDTHECLPSETTEKALRNRKGAARDRDDIIELKATCNIARARLGPVPMGDLGRFIIEGVFRAVEELKEAEE